MKIRIPLVEHDVAGIRCPLPIVTLGVRDRYGGWVDLYFRVDTQADFTTIPMGTAQEEGIPFATRHPGTAYGLVGAVSKFRDRVRLRIAGREYEWPCDFVAAPSPVPEGRVLPEITAVLGRAGFLAEYAVAVDSGFLILTRLGPLRRWWRRCLHAVWHGFGLIHPFDEPL
jgi:hypothetical protein